jgi:alkaline phosphatase D
MPRFSRRSFLQQGLVLATAAGCAHLGTRVPLGLRAPLPEPFDFPAGPQFPVGVSSGDALSGSVRLASCYRGERATQLWLFHEDDLAEDRRSPPRRRMQALQGDGGMLATALDGLMPATRYAYAYVGVEDGGQAVERSVTGRFVTAPLPDAQPLLTFTASACARQRFGFDALARAARVDSAFHVLLGDTSYNDGAQSLPEYRDQWMGTLARQEYVALRAATSVVGTWDDHEVANNWYPGGMERAQQDAASRAFSEFVPWRSGGDGFRMWRSHRWGSTAELFVLDLYTGQNRRQQRLISQEQMDWLRQSLKASPAMFKVVVTSLPISTLPFPANLYKEGRWGGFPDQREQLLSTTRDVPGCFYLAGDVHMPAVGRADQWGAGRGQLEVLVGPAAHDVNPMWHTFVGPQWDWAGGFNNTVALQLDPQMGTVTVTFVDTAGRERSQHVYTV